MWVTQQVREEGDRNPTPISRLELAKGSPFPVEVSRALIITSKIRPWGDSVGTFKKTAPKRRQRELYKLFFKTHELVLTSRGR